MGFGTPQKVYAEHRSGSGECVWQFGVLSRKAQVGWDAGCFNLTLLQVEREKAILLANLQESQTQLEHTKGALTEQHERVHRLTEHVNAMRGLQSNKEMKTEHDCEKGRDPSEEAHDYEVDINGLEILECKYKVAVTEVIDLKAEIKALKEKYNNYVENYTEEKAKYESRIQTYNEQVTSLEKSTKESQEKMVHMEKELQRMTSIANENHNTLNTAQDELVTFSEELAQLYHHVCLCNNETPNRVMLDYYRQSRVTRSGSLKGPDDPRGLLSPRLARRGMASPVEARTPTEQVTKEAAEPGKEQSPTKTPTISPVITAPPSSPVSDSSDIRKEPMNIYNLNAIIRDQIKHLQKAVDRSLQLSRQRAAARELAPMIDKDKEALMEEILKLKSLLSTKREQIATLRAVLKANKQVRCQQNKRVGVFVVYTGHLASFPKRFLEERFHSQVIEPFTPSQWGKAFLHSHS